jgi:UDP-glucose 4-epimerase
MESTRMNVVDKNILITGGAGFIGSHLARRFVNLGANIRVLDNFSAGGIENLLVLPEIDIIRGDVRDYETVKKAIEDQDFIFNFAANASVPVSVNNPRKDFEANVIGTFNILNALVETESSSRLFHASTGSVYGEPSEIPIPEDAPLNPISPYGASKLVCETYSRVFHITYGIRVVLLRFFNVYGPLQPRYVMIDLIKRLQERPKKLKVLGTGEQIRDFIFIDDAINAILFLVEKANDAEAYNIGTGIGTSIKKLAGMIVRLYGLERNTVLSFTGESWKSDGTRWVADISKIRNLGFEPKIALTEGLKRLKGWIEGDEIFHA